MIFSRQHKKTLCSATTGASQRGLSLPMVLIFLLIISLLAVVGLRRATLNEALSRNQIEFETAKQAAEAALKDAERDLNLPTGALLPNALCDRASERPLWPPAFDTVCTRGQCRFPPAFYLASDFDAAPPGNSPNPWWPVSRGGLWGALGAKPSDAAGVNTNCAAFTGGVPIGTFTGTPRLPTVARQPEYIIEYFQRPGDVERFTRITARGFGTDIRTEYVAQSIFVLYK